MLVDLGLPSGILWSTCNIGANYEHEIGTYLDAPQSQDIATSQLGSPFRLPTKAECEELINNTNRYNIENWKNTGINGVKFVSKTDSSKYIFISYSGYYIKSSSETSGVESLGDLWLKRGDDYKNYYLEVSHKVSGAPSAFVTSDTFYSSYKFVVRAVVG